MVDRRYTPSDKRLPAELVKIQESLKDIQKPTGTEKNRSLLKLQEAVSLLEVQQEQLQQLFNRMPQNAGMQRDTTGWSVNTPPATGSWTTVATVTLARPANMNRVAVTAVASASAIVNSDAFGQAMQSRIVINGTASVVVEGSVETLSSVYRTHAQQGFFREISDLTSGVTVQFQVRGRMSEYASSNTASLTVSAGFTRVGA